MVCRHNCMIRRCDCVIPLSRARARTDKGAQQPPERPICARSPCFPDVAQALHLATRNANARAFGLSNRKVCILKTEHFSGWQVPPAPSYPFFFPFVAPQQSAHLTFVRPTQPTRWTPRVRHGTAHSRCDRDDAPLAPADSGFEQGESKHSGFEMALPTAIIRIG
jgi:hypothetical protein